MDQGRKRQHYFNKFRRKKYKKNNARASILPPKTFVDPAMPVQVDDTFGDEQIQDDVCHEVINGYMEMQFPFQERIEIYGHPFWKCSLEPQEAEAKSLIQNISADQAELEEDTHQESAVTGLDQLETEIEGSATEFEDQTDEDKEKADTFDEPDEMLVENNEAEEDAEDEPVNPDCNEPQLHENFTPELYKLSRKAIGKGAFGEVHRGDLKEGHEPSEINPISIAVKTIEVLHETEDMTEENFSHNELDILKSSLHPNIVKYYSFQLKYDDQDDPLRQLELKIYMELCDTCLGSLLKDRRLELEQRHLKSMTIQIGKGLSYLHSKQIVHRDMKPDNILIAYSSQDRSLDSIQCKITDFGLATNLSDAQLAIRTMSAVGTPGWLAPEVIEAHDHYQKKHRCDPYATDIFSFGLIILNIFGGIFFTIMELHPEKNIQKIIGKKLEDNNITDRDVQFSVRPMLSKDPDKRPKMQEVLQTPLFLQEICLLRYERLKVLGSGSFGLSTLYQKVASEDNNVPQKIVVKYAARNQFNKFGLNAHSKLRHENILMCLQADTSLGDQVTIILEHCDENLQDFLATRTLKMANQLEFCLQMISGLKYLHGNMNKGHGNLTPNNVLVSSRYNKRFVLKLADSMSDNYDRQFGQLSFHFMAPEVAQSYLMMKKQTLNWILADLFSLGLLFFFVREGKMTEDFDEFKHSRELPNERSIQDGRLMKAAWDLCKQFPQERAPLSDIKRFLLATNKGTETEEAFGEEEVEDKDSISNC